MGVTAARAVKDTPILFSGEMVKAILEGRKVATRRVMKPAPEQPPTCRYENLLRGEEIWGHANGTTPPQGDIGYRDGRTEPLCVGLVKAWRCPFGQSGDRLWVREAWALTPRTAYWHDPDLPHQISPDGHSWAVYREGWERSAPGQWKPSIHMPRWASRLTLEVVSAKPQRLHDMSRADAIAEGMPHEWEATNYGSFKPDPLAEFACRWDALNGPRGVGWDANPWVWVIEFRKAEATPCR